MKLIYFIPFIGLIALLSNLDDIIDYPSGMLYIIVTIQSLSYSVLFTCIIIKLFFNF
jgi:hypothetical protein